MRKHVSVLLTTLLGLSPAVHADQALSVRVPQLTLGTALKIAHAALAACRAKGFQVTATVVDREGIPQVVLRDTIAAPLSLSISRDKAYTAAMFRARGTELQRQPRHEPLAQAGEHLVFGAGSVPIEAGGLFYGAVGVSGTPSGAVDEACAEAGVEAVRTALDMQ